MLTYRAVLSAGQGVVLAGGSDEEQGNQDFHPKSTFLNAHICYQRVICST